MTEAGFCKVLFARIGKCYLIYLSRNS